MKRAIYTIITVALSATAAQAQITYPDYDLNWHSKGIPVTKPVKDVTDSIYRTLVPGTSIKLALLSYEERQLPELERARISYGRAEELMNLFRKNRIPQKDFEVEMVPFHQPNRLRTSEITSRGYRSFMSRKSESYFLIHRATAHATSTAQLKFDASTSRERETFGFTASVDNKIILASGTQFIIPANCFVTKSGHAPKANEIQANIAEYKNKSALVMKNMTTTCNGQMLQSNGMWHIAFTAKGEELQVAPGKHYNIKIGVEGQEAKMQVFTGEIKNGMIDWKLQTDGVVNKVTESSGPSRDIAKEEKEVVEIQTETGLNDNRNLNRNNWNNVNKQYELNNNIGFRDEATREENDAVYDKIQGVTNHNLYELKLNDVGWINCDAFVNVEEKTELTVQCDTTTGLNAMLVFTKRKSVLPGYACTEKGVVKFSNIPVGETALLVVFKTTGDGKVIKYSKMVNPGNDKNIIAALKPSTQDKLTAEINGATAD